jgi:hypothetical protein
MAGRFIFQQHAVKLGRTTHSLIHLRPPEGVDESESRSVFPRRDGVMGRRSRQIRLSGPLMRATLGVHMNRGAHERVFN